MNQTADILQLLTAAKKIISKLHYIILLSIMAIIVGFTVMTVSNTLNMPSDKGYADQLAGQEIIENFDKDPTIPRIDKLEFSNQLPEVSLPAEQRINPFMECYDKHGNLLTYDPGQCYDKDGNLIYRL